MTHEEEKDFAEKVIRLRPKCCEELGVQQDKLSMDSFVKWLVNKVAKYEEKHNDKSHIDISI